MKLLRLPALAFALIFPLMKTSAADLPATVTVRLVEANGEPGAAQSVPTVKKTEAEWKQLLGAEAFQVLRAQGTERPFCGTLLNNKKEGVYFCAGCDLPLFTSRNKFDSGTVPYPKLM